MRVGVSTRLMYPVSTLMATSATCSPISPRELRPASQATSQVSANSRHITGLSSVQRPSSAPGEVFLTTTTGLQKSAITAGSACPRRHRDVILIKIQIRTDQQIGDENVWSRTVRVRSLSAPHAANLVGRRKASGKRALAPSSGEEVDDSFCVVGKRPTFCYLTIGIDMIDFLRPRADRLVTLGCGDVEEGDHVVVVGHDLM